jgi:cell division protein FtsL
VRKKKAKYMTYQAQARKKPRLNMRFIAKWSVFAFIVLATAVIYVWQRNTTISLGYEISDLRKRISVAGNEEQKLRTDLVSLQSPQRLLKEVKERQLGLEVPSPNQKMTLLTPPPLDSEAARPRGIGYPPAASQPLAQIRAATPHRDNSSVRKSR